MEFEGILVQKLPETSGTSARGEWFRQDVVFEMVSQSPYPRKVCVKFFNKRDEVARLVEGAAYIVSFDIDCREYNGRWYTDINAWRVQPKELAHATTTPAAEPQVAAPISAPAPMDIPMPTSEPVMGESSATPVDDLPF